MLTELKEFLKENRYGVLMGTALSMIAGIVLHATWKDDQERRAFIDRIEQSDVTAKVCPSDKPVTSLAHTLAPILDIRDRMTQKSGGDMLRKAMDNGVTFAFCVLAEGSTSYEGGTKAVAPVSPVLKINDAVTAQEQQASILQFLKEYQNGRVSPHYNAVVKADAGLIRAMPGRLPPEMDAHDYKRGLSETQSNTYTNVYVNIPSR